MFKLKIANLSMKSDLVNILVLTVKNKENKENKGEIRCRVVIVKIILTGKIKILNKVSKECRLGEP